ncbi:N-acetyltransferase GCN5 [Rhizobium albus]|nr:N-acetyltransferase GCN5 [Rhizobium albus]
MPNYQWRRAVPDDVPHIAEISSIALAGYPEEPAIFHELLALAPDGCFVMEMDGVIVGYLVGHPWMKGRPPALNQTIGTLPESPDCWYLHDLSLLEEARGFGAAREAVRLAAEAARAAGLDDVALVAVNGAGGFWRAQGFEPMEPEAGPDGIASYGDDAIYMERRA